MIKYDKSISNILILLSITVTALTIPFPWLYNFGMNNYFIYVTNDAIGVLVQFGLYQFLHGGILHILSNSIFIFIFGNQIENLIGKNRYITFFFLNTIFTGVCLLFLADGNTVGISGFAMAILGFMFMQLRKMNHPDYRGAGVFLIINILIGFTSNISLIGHLSGAVFGILYFYMLNSTLFKVK